MKLYESGDWGYAQFRIPCLLATSSGELLALGEARSNPRSDSGRIRILLRGSRDGGQSWSAPQVVAEDGDNTVGNPCLVEHRPSKTLQLIYNGNDGSVTEADILAGHGARRVYRMESRDGGEHLSPLREDLALREPVCQGSALSWGGALLFLNPDDDWARRRLTLKFSLNGGLSWAKHSVIRSGPAAYSDMAVLNGRLFMLFEAGEDDPYSWIELTSCPLTAEGLQKKWNLEKNRN